MNVIDEKNENEKIKLLNFKDDSRPIRIITTNSPKAPNMSGFSLNINTQNTLNTQSTPKVQDILNIP